MAGGEAIFQKIRGIKNGGVRFHNPPLVYS